MRAAAWATAVFTLFLTVFTYLLVKVTREMRDVNERLYQVNRQATESSVASQRAFLSIAFSPRLEFVVANNKVTGYKVHTGWANSGTPTQAAIAQFNVAEWPDRPGRGLDFAQLPQAERQEYVVGPKASWEVTTVPPSFDMVASLTSGKHLFAWGWVAYRDIFAGSPPRLSEFCFEFTNPKYSGPDHTSPATGFSLDSPPCQTHNCYDERCEDYPKLSQEIK